MKRWILVVGIVVIGIVAYLAWPKAGLEEPIVMSVQFDEMSKTLAISYIVSQSDHTFIKGVSYDTKEFYSPRSGDESQVLVKEDGYELREDVVDLSEEQLAYLGSLEARTLPVDILFDTYSPVETILVLLLKDETTEVTEITEQDEELIYTFIAPEDLTIYSIGHYDSVATISFEEDKMPLVLKKGQSTEVFIHEPYKFSTNDELLLEITTINDQVYTQHFSLKQPIPKGYLKRIVNEENVNAK